jgi:hypothetical protein
LGCLNTRLVSKLNRRRHRNRKQSRILPNLLRLALNHLRQPLNSSSGRKTVCRLLNKWLNGSSTRTLLKIAAGCMSRSGQWNARWRCL